MRVKELQRAAIWFCQKKGDSIRDCFQSMTVVFGGDCFSERSVQRWWRDFSSGVRDKDSITARNDENATKVLDLVMQDRRITIAQLVFETGLSTGSVQKLLRKDLKMNRVAAKFVPRMLRDEELTRRMAICQHWIDNVEADPTILDCLITGDETWVWCYDPETKQQSSQWIRPGIDDRPKKFRRSRSTCKVMLTAFFDRQGIVHTEYTQQRITAEAYVETLMRLRDSIRVRRPERWRRHDWILVDDNASVHTADETEQFLHQVKMEKGPHPAYSPDLAPCDFFLFPTLKRQLRGRRFNTVDELKVKVEEVLGGISQEQFRACFEDLQNRWEKCIAKDGHYFEGDKV